MEILDIPVPNDLYVDARKASQTSYAAHRELWTLKEGKTIGVIQDVADGFIFSQNMHAENDRQKELRPISSNMLYYQTNLMTFYATRREMVRGSVYRGQLLEELFRDFVPCIMNHFS